MANQKKGEEPGGLIERFRTSEHPGIAFAREILWVAAVVAGIAVALFLISGTWPAVVTIESESMVPHMNVGDLVFVVRADRLGDLQTWESGQVSGYTKFGDYGDVLIYAPNGAGGSLVPGLGGGVHPIIHRVLAETPDGSAIPVYYYFFRGTGTPAEFLPVQIVDNAWVLEDGTVVARIENGMLIPDSENSTPDQGYILTSGLVAEKGGYITKGDNNVRSDQGSFLSRTELGIIQPVRDEWVVGKALFAIPLLGYIPLNIIPVAVILIVLMLVWELYQKQKSTSAKKTTGTRRKGRK
jgi:signal peptidase